MTNKQAHSLHQVPTLEVLEKRFFGLETFLFDMDGTLFDTERYHAEALLAIGVEHRIRSPHSPEDLHQLMMGKADHFVFEIAKSWENFPKHWSVVDFVKEKNRLLLHALSQEDPRHYLAPAIKELLISIKQKKYFLGLVTSSEKIVTEALLKYSGLHQLFDLILTRDDCPSHKPDPWPYKKAMELASTTSDKTIIFEDSQVGLTAALASGAHTIKASWYQGFKI